MLELYAIADGLAEPGPADPTVVFCVDEFRPLSLHTASRPAVGPGGARQGRSGRSAAPSTAGDFHPPAGDPALFAALNLARDKLYGHVTRRKRRTQFLASCRNLRSPHPGSVRIAIVCANFSPYLSTRTDDRVGRWAAANNVEIACTPPSTTPGSSAPRPGSPHCDLPPDGTTHQSHREQARMIRRYIAWRNGHVADPRLRKVIKRASTVKRAKVA